MKAIFASVNSGVIGLLFFFGLFLAVVIWTYSPSRKKEMEKLKNIPFDDEDDHDKA